MVVRCTAPGLRALPETVEAFLELRDEWNSGLVAALVSGGHFDENFLLYASVEECCLNVQHVDLVAQLPTKKRVPRPQKKTGAKTTCRTTGVERQSLPWFCLYNLSSGEGKLVVYPADMFLGLSKDPRKKRSGKGVSRRCRGCAGGK